MIKDDLISRQAVLEGIRNLYPDIPIVNIMGARRKWLEKYAPYFECENVVEQLPPVTPYENVTEFADRCKECGAKYGKLLKQKSDNWIPVSERLPEDHKNVLIYLSSNKITIGLYNSHRLPFTDKPMGWGANTSHDWSSDEVIAWMPLPEPYLEVR